MRRPTRADGHGTAWHNDAGEHMTTILTMQRAHPVDQRLSMWHVLDRCYQTIDD
jgi:hypothetical protein